MQHRLALFGQAEKGKFHVPYVCHSLPQLSDIFGNPPKDTYGLFFAIQALLYEREILFFRVKEEGYSVDDYLQGLNFLKMKNKANQIDAICIPGVGSMEIVEATNEICLIHKSFIITTEKDLYDYLTL